MLSFFPIGHFRGAAREPAAAPRQGSAAPAARGAIELLPGRGYETALDDLAGFERLWVVFVFDQARGWKPKVLPPRGGLKRGLFATRSPHRPNPIGLSCVRLLGIDGLRLDIAECDLLDGSPVLDLKPYLPYADAFPDAKAGWTDALNHAPWAIDSSPLIAAQLDWLARAGCAWDLEALSMAMLSEDPTPAGRHRIRELGAGFFELAVKTWRLRFSLDPAARRVERLDLSSGYGAAALAGPEESRWGDHELHRRFLAEFPPSSEVPPCRNP
ncbi:MAG: hypothetical protein RL095_1293 [Verrucomicrobiota bacterium]|jgi:tRNA-Thr(GGU) m(6)t(6)A37 methyltransferase TsaA